MMQLSGKIRIVKDKLKTWSRHHFSKLNQRVTTAKSVLDRIQGEIQARPLDEELAYMEKVAIQHYIDLSNAEEESLKQMARDNRITLGDENNSYFHRMVKGRHKVSWQKICKPKQEGGLDVHDIDTWNRAAICELAYKLMAGPHTLSQSWVNNHLIQNQHFWTMATPNDSSHIWRGILKIRDEMSKFVEYSIGKVYEDEDDTMIWTPHPRGKFSVATAYEVLRQHAQLLSSSDSKPGYINTCLPPICDLELYSFHYRSTNSSMMNWRKCGRQLSKELELTRLSSLPMPNGNGSSSTSEMETLKT
ncbi:hypothetical protein FRX31_028227 [Thalictrum thalictroides]|uniref:Uncharacterized protein n=1 Tax=Thalictrum thalictroides TaxID=46969 RepID=A0A7J6VD94_THATH|nr:hypothetical protein FRX31_028227 [Thalictrum thalictroides]